MQKNNVSTVLAINWIILVLGMVLLTQFYSLFFHDVFSSTGWINFLNDSMQYNKLGSFQYDFLLFLKKTAPVSTYLFAAGLFTSALACTLLIARFYVCIIVAIVFFIAWILGWKDPGMWPFEFLFPVIFALLAGLSMRTFSLRSQSVVKSFPLIILLSVFLYYVTFIAFNEPHFAHKVALSSALSFFILCSASFIISRKKHPEKDEKNRIDKYLDIMIISIGSMLILQVYINYFSGSFEVNNFRENIAYFAKTTNATWLRGFLTLNATYSHWILPPYALFEIFLSISLTLLLIRAPVLLLAAGLLGLLTFAELGVSATWPPTPNNLIWEWELLLPTAVSIIIGIHQIIKLKENFSLKKLVVGNPIGHQHSISFITALFISVASGILLYFVALTAHAFIGNSYQITATYSGISFAV